MQDTNSVWRIRDFLGSEILGWKLRGFDSDHQWRYPPKRRLVFGWTVLSQCRDQNQSGFFRLASRGDGGRQPVKLRWPNKISQWMRPRNLGWRPRQWNGNHLSIIRETPLLLLKRKSVNQNVVTVVVANYSINYVRLLKLPISIVLSIDYLIKQPIGNFKNVISKKSWLLKISNFAMFSFTK